MFLPLPRLDDRRWAELVEEARALVPLHAPEWTDHNVSDPGITFAELFAWIAEMQVFAVDQVPDRHRRKFLELLGVQAAPPRPARTILRFGVPPGTTPAALPATLEYEPSGPPGPGRPYRTLDSLRVVPVRLVALRSLTAAGARELTDRWQRGEGLAPFGADPQPGDALELALDAALPRGVPVSIAVTVVAGDGHSSGRIAWELWGDGWRRLDPAADEVTDDTRGLTRDGRLEIRAPVLMQPGAEPGGDRFLLRARYLGGPYDAAPELLDIAVNGVAAEQSVPAGALTWTIAPDAGVVGTPRRGRRLRFALEVDGDTIKRLEVTDDLSAPELLVLGYRPPSAVAGGSLTVEAASAGRSPGAPWHAVRLLDVPVDVAGAEVWTLEGVHHETAAWRAWSITADLDASGPGDAHVVLEPANGTLRFGDGVRGLVPAEGATIVVVHRTTRAGDGGVIAGAVDRFAETAHNEALLSAWPVTPTPDVTNPVAGSGGAAAETLEHAEGRALELARGTTRAVTAADYEWLARRTPGVRLSRVAVQSNAHPGFACVNAPGVMTVIVLPFLPPDRPAPSRATRRAVEAHLARHRVVGTRLEVTGPTYTEVAVVARVRPQRVAVAGEVARRVTEALDAFLHPLRGGPAGDGWPFGRDVVRSEVLQVIDGVPGVDHVLALELRGPCGVSCGDLCIGPQALAASGAHEIEVLES